MLLFPLIFSPQMNEQPELKREQNNVFLQMTFDMMETTEEKVPAALVLIKFINLCGSQRKMFL